MTEGAPPMTPDQSKELTLCPCGNNSYTTLPENMNNPRRHCTKCGKEVFPFNRPLTPQPAAKDEELWETGVKLNQRTEELSLAQMQLSAEKASVSTLTAQLTALGLQVEGMRQHLKNMCASMESIANDYLEKYSGGVLSVARERLKEAKASLSLPLSSYEHRAKAMETALNYCLPLVIAGTTAGSKRVGETFSSWVQAEKLIRDALSSEEPK